MHRLRSRGDRDGPLEFVCDALMITFGVVVCHEVVGRVLKRGQSEETNSVQTLRFHRALEAFGEHIQIL